MKCKTRNGNREWCVCVCWELERNGCLWWVCVMRTWKKRLCVLFSDWKNGEIGYWQMTTTMENLIYNVSDAKNYKFSWCNATKYFHDTRYSWCNKTKLVLSWCKKTKHVPWYMFSRDARKQNSCDLSAVSLPQTLITSLVNSPALQDQHKHSQ